MKTIGLKDTLLAICSERADSWSDTVKACILHVHDLHAPDAVYHQTCSVNFRTGHQKSIAHQSASTEDFKRPNPGWPQVDERAVVFLQVAHYLEENDNEQITIDHLIDLMEQKLANCS